MGRVTWKGLLAHRLRFALTALAVMLGVAFMSGTLVLTDTVKRTFDDLFANVYKGTDAVVRNRSNITSRFGGTLRDPVSADLVPQIQRVDGVKAVEGNVQFYAQLVDKQNKAIGTPGQGAPTFGFNWGVVRALNPLRLEPGGHAPRGPDQVVIDAKSAKDGHFRVGEQVKVLTQQAPKLYEIVGIAKFGNADSPGGASVSVFETTTAQVLAGEPGKFDNIGVVGDGSVSETTLRSRIRDSLDNSKLQVLTGSQITKETQNQVEKNLSFFNTALLVFAGVALLVGSFIIFNTFSIIVAQRTREMALLRAIGASGRQVMGSVLGESGVVGVAASLVGLVGGVLLAVALKELLAAFGIDIPAGGVVIAPRTIVVAIVVGTLVTMVSAVFPARKAARVAPVAALRDVAIEGRSRLGVRTVLGAVMTALGVAFLFVGLFAGIDNGIALVGVGALVIFLGVTVLAPVIARPASQAIGSPLPHIKGITGTLARENAERNPKRTSATAAALMIGVALVAFITIFAASTKQTIAVQVDRAFRSDYIITTGGFGGPGTGFSPQLATDVAKLPEVGASSPLRFNAAQIDGATHFLVAANPSTITSLFEIDLKQGNVSKLDPSTMAISEQVANNKNWKIGSQVPVKFPNGTQTLTVAAIYGNGQQAGLSDYFISTENFQRHYTEQLVNQVYVKLKPGASPSAGKKAIEGVLKPYPNAKLQDQAQFKADQVAQINQLLNLIYALLALAVVIALIGIANTLALSIYERTRELGLLRAVGMSRRQLRSSVRWESVIIALLGTLLGLVIGLFFGWSVVRSLRDQGITEFSVPPAQVVVIVLVGLLVGVVAAIFPARRAAKLDVLRAVTHE